MPSAREIVPDSSVLSGSNTVRLSQGGRVQKRVGFTDALAKRDLSFIFRDRNSRLRIKEGAISDITAEGSIRGPEAIVRYTRSARVEEAHPDGRFTPLRIHKLKMVGCLKGLTWTYGDRTRIGEVGQEVPRCGGCVEANTAAGKFGEVPLVPYSCHSVPRVNSCAR